MMHVIRRLIGSVAVLTAGALVVSCGGDPEATDAIEGSTPTASESGEASPSASHPDLPTPASDPPPSELPDASTCIELFPPESVSRPGAPDLIGRYLFAEAGEPVADPPSREVVDSSIEALDLMVSVTASDTLKPSIGAFVSLVKEDLAAVDADEPDDVDMDKLVAAVALMIKACGDNFKG